MSQLELLSRQFPGQVFIPMTKAGLSIGYAEQTSYNLHHKGKFPLPVRKVGRKNMVALLDLAAFMDGKIIASEPERCAPATEEKEVRRVGRPTKAEQIAARRRAAAAAGLRFSS